MGGGGGGGGGGWGGGGMGKSSGRMGLRSSLNTGHHTILRSSYTPRVRA